MRLDFLLIDEIRKERDWERKMRMKHSKIKSRISFFILLTLCFFLPGGEVILAKSVQKKQSVDNVPVVYPRSSWSSSKYEKRTKKIWPPKYNDPEVIIIHHTATNYKGATSKQIKKIYRYHSYTRKWGDIGYNYIIGKDGSIFEGRAGGNGAIGGHAYYNGTNYNSGSIGIAVLGNYASEKLSAESLDALEKLVGWLSANNSIEINSEVRFHGKKLNSAVVGHKDVASTACPGKNIYNNLGSIRTAGAALGNTFSNYAYRASGDGTTYEIRNGKKYSGSSKQPVVEISSTQLSAYPTDGEAENKGSLENFPSGTLFENESSGQKGILENGTVRPIASSAVLTENYNLSNFVKISAEKWASYPAGAAAVFRNGAFLRDESGNYYLISEGNKRRLVLPEAENIRIEFARAQAVSNEELSAYPDGENITSAKNFPAGTIVTTGSRNYFYIRPGGIKQKISMSVFNASFTSGMVMKVSQKIANEYKTRGSLSFQDGAVVNYNKKYYFIENGLRREFASKNLATEMGYKNIAKAKRSEMKGIGEGAKIE